MRNQKLKVAIVGASGYTGSELAAILLHHPHVEIRMITSETHAGKPFSDLHPQFLTHLDIPLVSADMVDQEAENLDFIFLALPHRVSMDFVKRWNHVPAKIIDFSGDFRLSNPRVYEQWYGKEHSFAAGFNRAIYGLPELHREAIRSATLVANPGCFPTASILSVAPLVLAALVNPETVVVDAKSGITGAGIKASSITHFSNVNENFKAYGIKTHRHTIEIEEQLSALGNVNMAVQFTPHLLPVDRGILATTYATPRGNITQVELEQCFVDFYASHPFVRMRSTSPEIKQVRGSNYCDIYPVYDERTHRVLVFSAIDNLVKGAAGQAVHNMNLMAGLEETTGLLINPLKP